MDQPSEHIRSARLEDAQRIAEYQHECRLLAFTPLFDAAIVQRMRPKVDRWRSWLEPDSEFVTRVVVDRDDVPFGHVTVQGNVLAHLFIDPPRHRHGFGRTLLGIGEQLIIAAGHTNGELQTRVGNDAAIALYQSAGWVMTDELRTDEDDPDVAVQEHVLRKQFVLPSRT